MNHTLDIKAVDKYKYRPSKDSREFKELDFDTTLHKLWEEYMDIYEGCEDTEYYVMYLFYCSPMLFLDNSDSPSIVEH